jgi:hypothetical protein
MSNYMFLYLKTVSGHLAPASSMVNNIKNAALSYGVGQMSDYILKFQ